MNEADAMELVQAAFRALIFASGPIIVTAMLVGTIIALLQALTQIQDVTLTFIPKILAVLLVTSVSAPFIAGQVNILARLAFSHIATGF
jgi:flagellar biosynthetic protein FliQ